MSSDGRTFRVFVSSTFEDFRLERDALQHRVFAPLQQLCARRGGSFRAIDLRWGVSEDAARDQQTIGLCLQEIERCRQATPRPNFLALVGDRYGWRPLPRALSLVAFRQVAARAEADTARLLEAWYQEDANAVPPERVLLSRLEVAGAEDPGAWSAIEERLRSAIEAVLGPLPSATEQEIRAGVLDVAGEDGHAFAVVRHIEGLPAGAAARGYRDVDAAGRSDDDARDRLDQLETRLTAQLGANVFGHRATWTGAEPVPITADHLGPLCDDVRSGLERIITRELDDRDRRDPLELELQGHKRAAERLGAHVAGRDDELATLLGWIDDPTARIGVVEGAWGSGKTALMARFAQALTLDRPRVTLVNRFLSEMPSATVLRGLLESLVRQLARLLGDEPVESSTLDHLVARLRDLLERAGRERPVVLLLDGLDLLAEADSARTFFWLPSAVPAGVTLLLSSATGECARVMAQRLPGARRLGLGDLPPASARDVVRDALERAERRLQPAQWQAVEAGLAGCRLPLFVELLVEELREWRSFDTAPPVPGDVATLVRERRDRLAQGRRHGPTLLSRCLGLIGSAKNGLAEDELLALLSDDEAVMADFRARNPRAPDVSALPFIIWARLRSDLARYLREVASDGTTLLSFRQRQIEALLEDGAAGERVAFHAALQRHFTRAWEDVAAGLQRRALAELPYQQLHVGDWSALDATLTDVRFLEAKMAAGLGFELLADFERLPADGTGDAQLERCRVLGRALANVFDFVRDTPENLGPQLHLELQVGDMEAAKELLLRVEVGCADRVWLQRHQQRTSARAWHEAQTGYDRTYLHFLRFSPDGCSLLHADWEGRLTRWDWRTGVRTEAVVPAGVGKRSCFRSGALLDPSAFAFASTDEVWILSLDDVWSGDLKRGVWRRALAVAKGEAIERLVGEEASGHALLAVRDGRGGHVWDLDPNSDTVRSRRSIPELNPQQGVNHIASAPAGRPRALCLDSGHLIVSSGLTVRAHEGGALHCEFVPGGPRIATCGVDGTLALYDPARGLVSRIEFLFGHAECLACAPSGRCVAVGHRDGQVSLVGLEPETSVRFFSSGVAGWVLSLAFSACGRFLAVGGRNGGVRIFAVGKAPEAATFTQVPRGDAVRATWLEDEGPCVFEDGEEYVFSTGARVSTAQLPLKIVTHCADRARGLVLAILQDHRLRAIDPQDGHSVFEQTLPPAARHAATVAADGSTLALLEDDGVTLMVWQPGSQRWAPSRRLPLDRGDWRHNLPLQLSRDGARLFLPLETVISGTRTGRELKIPDLPRRIVALDTTTGRQLFAIPYAGFCTALVECPREDVVIAAFGDGPVPLSDTMVWHRVDRGVRAHSLVDGRLLWSLDTPEAELGITGLDLDPAQEMIATTSRAGYVRLAPLRGDGWSACVRLPSGALGPRFGRTGRSLWVADVGRENNHWPAEHEFLVRLIHAESPGEA
jgi:NACHT domain- and WD repeat-containing protein